LTYGQGEVIKASVTTSPPNPSNTPNGGQVQFYETSSSGTQTLLGTESLTDGGTAMLSTTSLAAGFDALTATYTGTSAYARSTTTNLSEWNITVQKAVLTISVASVSRYASQGNPAFTILYSAFVNADTPASLTAGPRVTTSATAASAPGAYPLILGGASSPNYTFNYVNGTLTVSAAPVSVLGVSVQKITVGRHKTVQVIVLDFSGALNPVSAHDPGAYSLATVGKGKQKSKRVALSKATYNAALNTVALTTAKKLSLSPPLLLSINAAGLLDAENRPLDGNGDGQPGGNFVATLGKGRATIDSALALGESSLHGRLVDAVLGAGFRPRIERVKER